MNTDRIDAKDLIRETMDFPDGCEDKKLEFLSQFSLSDSYSAQAIIDAIDACPNAIKRQKDQFKENLGLIDPDPFANSMESVFTVKIKKTRSIHRNERSLANAILDGLQYPGGMQVSVSLHGDFANGNEIVETRFKGN